MQLKLILITVCGGCVILLLAYAGQAGFNLLNGRPISHAQRDVLDCIIFIAPIVVSWIAYQLDWWQTDQVLKEIGDKPKVIRDEPTEQYADSQTNKQSDNDDWGGHKT